MIRAALLWAVWIIFTASVVFPAKAEPSGDISLDPIPTEIVQGLTLKQAAEGTYRMYHGNSFICSGVFVKSTDKEDLFMTAAHCGGGKPLSITLDKFDDKFKKISSQIFYLKPVRTLKRLDIMLFKLMDSSGEFNVSPIAEQKEADLLEFGKPIIAIGYPKGLEITMTRGDFMNRVKPLIRILDQEEPVYKVSIPFTGGSSGGAVWVKTELGYKIVGLVSHGWTDVSFMGYVSTAKSIHRVTRNLLGE